MRIDNPIGIESNLTGSFSGSFVGDGSGLFNLPFTSISGSPTLISSSNQIQDEISGSFTFVSSSIVNRLTGSEEKIQDLIIHTGSYSTTSSLSEVSSSIVNRLTGSEDKIEDLIIHTGSYSTTSSLSNLSSSLQSRLTTDEVKIDNLTQYSGSYSTTGSNTFIGNQKIQGTLQITGDIIAQQFIVSSSVSHITESFSSGSTRFGDSLDDKHQITGSVEITGSLKVNGDSVSTTTSLTSFSSSITQRLTEDEVKIDNLTQFSGSYSTTSSLNNLSSSLQSRITTNEDRIQDLIIHTGSYSTTSSLNSLSSSLESRLTIDETKIEDLIIHTGSYSTTSSLNSFSSSITERLTTDEGKIEDLIIHTGSYSTTSSLNTLSSSLQSRVTTNENNIDNLTQYSGSYATTGSNTFTGNQTVLGDIRATGNIIAQQYVVSSSVSHITESFSSGSTRFGDTEDDTHIFTGSLDTQDLKAGGKYYEFRVNSESINYQTLPSNVKSYGAVAIGQNSVVGRNSGLGIALGVFATVSASSAVSLGSFSRTEGPSAIAIGAATAKSSQGIAIGAGAIANKQQQVVIGNNTDENDTRDANVVISAGSSGTPKNIAFFKSSSLDINGDLKVKNNLIVSGGIKLPGNFLLKNNSLRNKVVNLSSSTGSYSFEWGWGPQAIGDYSVALGATAYAEGYSSFAAGVGTQALGSQAVALGGNIVANGEAAFAAGAGLQTSGQVGSAALGRFNITGSSDILSIGNGTVLQKSTLARFTTSSLEVNGFISASTYYGDGSQLTGITVAETTTIEDSFTNQTSVTVNHNFNTKNIQVTVFDNNDYVLIPATIHADDLNSATITFDSTTSGRIVVVKGGHIVSGSAELFTHKESVSGNNQYTITHNLNEDYPIVQVYNNVKDQVIPANIRSTDSNNINISFDNIFTGVVVVKK